MASLLAALRRHPFLGGAFLLAAALALWLLAEVVSGALGWQGRGPEPLRPWMTVGYVGRTYGLDPRLIDATAGFPTPDEAGHPLTLAEIAARRGVPVEQVFHEVEAVLAELRPPHGRHDEDGPTTGEANDGAPPGEAAEPATPTDDGSSP